MLKHLELSLNMRAYGRRDFLAGLVISLMVSQCVSTGNSTFRLPYCEQHIGAIPPHSPELNALRDYFQIWIMNRRIEKDMDDLLVRMRQPPTTKEEIFVWQTTWNESQVDNRRQAASNTRKLLEVHIMEIVKHLRSTGLLGPSTTVQDLVHCTGGHLQPRLYPDQPMVSFMLQYFKRPRVIETWVNALQVCNKLVPSELLVNVDSPQEGQIWADLSWSTRGFVVPVMSYNVHELRGYNRLGGMARGKYMVLIQDDDKLLPEDCSWLPPLVKQFEAMPSLAMVGLNKLQLSHGEGNDISAHRFFVDANTGNHMIFAFQVDLAPLAIRRSAFKIVGGLDEGFSDPGECGIWSDWELSIRFWAAGWHVAFMPLVQKASGDPSEPGGTHKPETGNRCWGRQQNLGSTCYFARWGAGFGSGPGKFLESLENYVRLTNLRLLKGSYTECPFRKGCTLSGDPPLPEGHREYMSELRQIVNA